MDPKALVSVLPHENGLISPEPGTLSHETIRKQVLLQKKLSKVLVLVKETPHKTGAIFWTHGNL